MRIATILLAGLLALPVSAAKDESTRILILVDASASMAVSWPNRGGDRMGAVRSTIDTLDAVFRDRDMQPEVAVRVFGDQTKANELESCDDTRLIRSWAPADENDLGASLDSIKPRGSGSLAGALNKALEDLETPSRTDLILIMLDGLNRCDRDLEEAFNSLTLEGKGAEVHIYGFGLNVTDQMYLSTFAPYHSVGWPSQLTQGIAMEISKRMSLPLLEESVGLDLVGIDDIGFDVAALEVVGTWNREPITVDLNRDQPRIKAGLGTGTVIASEAEPGQRQHLVRVPFVPERRIHIEFFEPSAVEFSAEIQDSGWGRPGVLQASWIGAPEEEMQLVLQENGTPGASWFHAETVVGPNGNTTLELPIRPAELALQLRRPVGMGDGIIAAVVLDSPGRSMSLKAPDKAEAGGSIEVTWDGESYPGDVVTLVPADAGPEFLGPVVDAIKGSPYDFFVPFDQCTYELRYIDGRSFEILDRTTLEVEAAKAGLQTMSVPEGSKEIAIRWWGPAGSLDVITLAAKDAEPADYLDWASPMDGSPARFQAPKTPGDYEIRYLVDGTIIGTSLPLVIDPIKARITLPERVRVGERINVSWTGPNNSDDFLVLVRQGKALGRQLDFAYVSEGSPTSLAAPDRPGIFEIRYVTGRKREVLASATVEVVK